MLRRSILLLAILSISALSGATAFADDDKDGARIVKPGHEYKGLSYGEWAARWWQWADTQPILNGNDHPLFGGDPGDVLRGNAGDVFFLAGVTGPEVRNITIPKDTALFFPLANAECSDQEAPPFFGATKHDRRVCANGWIDNVVAVTCEIDGNPVNDLDDFREQSPGFVIGPLPAANVLGLPEGTLVRSADAGIYLLIKPLEHGDHTIHFTATVNWLAFFPPNFTFIDTTYKVHVKAGG